MRAAVASCRKPALAWAAALLMVSGGAPMLLGSDPTPAPTAPLESDHSKPLPSTSEVKSELTRVIDAQLAAFRAEDYGKAYTFAASAIKEMFTREDFEGMVRRSYPVIAHSTSVDYGLAFDTGEEAVIYVRVQNTAAKTDAQYQYMLKKEDGVWKINGVSEVKPEGMSV